MRPAAAIVLALLTSLWAPAAEAPPWLPRYDVAVNLDVDGHTAYVTQHVTWVNRFKRPTEQLVFNVHSAYEPPTHGIDRLFLGKMLEIMRVPAGEGLYEGRSCDVRAVSLLRRREGKLEKVELAFGYREDVPTALEVELPDEVQSGESVRVCVEFVFHLPQKQGRWGQWKGVTFLSNWLPVVAYYSEDGWDPTPFVAWHQPFFNEAGVYDVRLRLPADEKVGTSGSVRKRVVDGTQQELWIGPVTTREFTILSSKLYEEYVAHAGGTKITCLALPGHDFYGEAIPRIAARAVETYTRWFGPYPNPELYFAESYFGWNGNECSGLVMVDARVFAMPKFGENYVEYLISHETCHQWFYNILGTDGYRETFMDEAFANYFAHRLLNQVHGKNNRLFQYPKGLSWLPTVNREDYRFSQFYGTIGRGELMPPLQEMPKYKHVGNLFSACYDRGGKILNMIEERLGEDAFLDFLRGVYRKYYFRIILAKDFQRELEEYTGRSWEDFFQRWLYDKGLTDWSLEKAEVTKLKGGGAPTGEHSGPYKAVVFLKQKAEYDEPTTLGFSFKEGEEKYPLRLPIAPQAGTVTIDSPPARIEALPDGRVRVEVLLPEKPVQISVDPDQILPDKDPANNHWKHRARVRVTPFYTFLDETDLTNAYDRWNYTFGPWFYSPSYSDPWFTRASVMGLRAGAYRTHQFTGGIYTGYRPDFRDLAVGIDGQMHNLLYPKVESGFHAEKSLTKLDGGGTNLDRASLWTRYIFNETASMYTAPMHHIETFGAWQQNYLPLPRTPTPDAVRFDKQTNVGVHYHLDLLTPYWDPEMGFKLDVTYAAGLPILGQPEMSHQVMGQLSWVHFLPEGLGYLSRTRLAYRAYGAAATPSDVQMFSLGGNLLFRGFDLRERQGSAMWIGSMEWRLPLLADKSWDVCDNAVGFRNLYLAAFTDVGDIYLRQHPVGPVAVAVGAGLRVELAWLSFLERTTFRIDFAKTVNSAAPMQIWFGLMHPF
jgi:hypothetical protein